MKTEKVTANMVRAKIRRLNISQEKVRLATEMPRGWFYKAITLNKKYAFIDPDPQRMQTIWAYLCALEDFQENWK